MWMPYSEMFDEFSQEIANSLNDLTNYTHRLKAWDVVLDTKTDGEKLDAAHEFIDPHRQFPRQKVPRRDARFSQRYNHRFSPRIVLGIMQIVTRTVNSTSEAVSYSFGGLPVGAAVTETSLHETAVRGSAYGDCSLSGRWP